MIVNNTPLETYDLCGFPILVKREDLCSPLPGPSFSKMRGVIAHLKSRPEQVIGVLDTYHSKAGHAVAYACEHLGKKCVDYWPRYKADGNGVRLPRLQQQRALDLGADLVPLQAGRSAILYHSARKHLAEGYSDSYMMPNALKLPESITENSAEALRMVSLLPSKGILVISISSGTVAAGVLKGFAYMGLLNSYRVFLHMGYSRSREATKAYIEKSASIRLGSNVMIIDEGYGYADAAPKEASAPFPCNPYYDLKTWHWLGKGGKFLLGTDPLIFWNIGD